ncbi:MAG: amidohydrolase family protein [Alphaproteobacteria bacterium]|nr:amidohydrolase family protein [Alphaproteobacteria bacterium]
MLDLVIRGDQVVTPHGVDALDVGIQGDKIVTLAAPGTLSESDIGRTIDATGKIVMPGGIDPHVHCLWHLPAPDGGQDIVSGPPEQVSQAALFGGTTTIIDFAQWRHGQTVQEAIEHRDGDWQGKCYCDYAYHVMLQGEIPDQVLDQLPEAFQTGYASLKIFTTDITPSRKGRMIDYGDIWELLQVTAREGGIAAIHAEDNDIVMHMYDKLIKEERVGFENMAEVHNTLSEDLAFRRIIRLAENVEGAALYMMHVSAESGVNAVIESRAKGYPIYGETLHQYLLYNKEDYHRPHGQIFHTYPSLKAESDQAALWGGMLNGSISTVATDEICCSLSVKVQGERIDDCTGGNSGVEPRIGVMYTEMVSKRGYSLEKFVEMTSSNSAKIMGMYPRKGAIAAGSDADIAIVDPSESRTVRKEDLHSTDYTPWEGHEVTAWPVITILRGKIMVENGKFFGDLKDGVYLSRKIPESIRGGAAL